MNKWHIYQGSNQKHQLTLKNLPSAPPWRQFEGKVTMERKPKPDKRTIRRGATYMADPEDIEMVNTALYLRRPLLVTGKPGVGKSSLACSVAYALGLGSVLHWPITTRTALQDGLYRYDALGRLQELQIKKHLREKAGESDVCETSELAQDAIGNYIRLGPLGTALLPAELPRVLLIDEIDKSDIDLPNDLLNVFEEGEFEIPELSRIKKVCSQVEVLPHDAGKDDDERVEITDGRVECRCFPFIVMTSNAERELPAPFLRRCLRLDIKEPNADKLAEIVQAHFDDADPRELKTRKKLLKLFFERRLQGALATDQLLNAVFLTTRHINMHEGVSDDKQSLIEAVFSYLDKMPR